MNALVVGHGRMGRFHARALRDLGFAVTTVDPDPAAGADHLAVPGRRFDVAAVATPVDCLAGSALAAALIAPRLLVEKPVAPTLHETRALAEKLEGRKVCVGFVERFNPRVQELKAQLAGPTTATFTRINDRPSWDVALDLRLHDIDLARYLGLDPDVCTYRTQAGAVRKVRRIDTPGYSVDLTAHAESPLHALWAAFLGDGDYPTLDDAVAAHEALAGFGLAVAA